MLVRYFTVDVFTDHAFGGNPLAVFPDASGIPEALLAPIAREFNYSETTFVLPPQNPRHTRRVRIFTPGGELPFAGHPTLGTAHVLASIGEIPIDGEVIRATFEEAVGPVPVTIRVERGAPVFAQLAAAQLPEAGPAPPSRDDLARVLSLQPADLLDGEWAPQAISCGVPFVFVPLRNREALGRARVRGEAWEACLRGRWASKLYVFSRDPEGPRSDIRARMFAPGIGVAEDPATGGACVALGGYLGWRDPRATETLTWTVEQGFEMGRPSLLYVEADKREGRIEAVRVGGRSVLLCEGTMRLPV
jgi:trans-2,3-dihydro-3-hydroxyanthranilate isomerase